MIKIVERMYNRKINKYKLARTEFYDTQVIKRTTVYLLGVIPIWIKDEIIKGSIERSK